MITIDQRKQPSGVGWLIFGLGLCAIMAAMFGCAAPRPGAAADPGDGLALLQQSITLQESALQRSQEAFAALSAIEPPPDPDPLPGTAINLAAFSWKGKKISDPTGLPSGARYGESPSGGKIFCQWEWRETLVLHAVFPVGTSAVNGSGAAWYHFTRAASDGGKPLPALQGYVWSASAPSDGWRRWRKK